MDFFLNFVCFSECPNFRDQKLNSECTLWHSDSMFGSSQSAISQILEQDRRSWFLVNTLYIKIKFSSYAQSRQFDIVIVWFMDILFLYFRLWGITQDPSNRLGSEHHQTSLSKVWGWNWGRPSNQKSTHRSYCNLNLQ